MPRTPRSNADRAERAYRTVLNYEADSSIEECISDLLGDLRHLCEESGYDFAERDDVGHRNYIAEKREADRAAEEIIPGVTVGSTEADMAEAGAMSASDGLGAAKAQAQENYGDDVSPDAVAIFCRQFIHHGATNVELGRAVRKLII